jgi:hypothetical protein
LVGATEPVEPYPLAVLGIAAIGDIDFQITTPNLPGIYYLRAQTDSSFQIEESNETNNTGDTITLTVRTPRHCRIWRLPATRDPAVAPGEQVQFLRQPESGRRQCGLAGWAGIGDLYLANHPGGGTK